VAIRGPSPLLKMMFEGKKRQEAGIVRKKFGQSRNVCFTNQKPEHSAKAMAAMAAKGPGP